MRERGLSVTEGERGLRVRERGLSVTESERERGLSVTESERERGLSATEGERDGPECDCELRPCPVCTAETATIGIDGTRQWGELEDLGRKKLSGNRTGSVEGVCVCVGDGVGWGEKWLMWWSCCTQRKERERERELELENFIFQGL